MATSRYHGTVINYPQQSWLTSECHYHRSPFPYERYASVIVGGESCELNRNQTSCVGGADQISKQRFTYINVEYHPTVV